jgi:transcriptional regulator with XRE-family HTH domain
MSDDSTPRAPRRRRGDPTALSARGRAIDAARQARGLSLLALAARAGVSRQHLYRVLRSDAPLDAALRARLERVLDARFPDEPAG